MAVFDPNDWWDGASWFKPSERERRPPAEINREAVTRWLASVALCLCFAALGPAERVGLSFAGLLIVAALASALVAAIRRDPFYAPHLTPWDEAVWSLALGLGLWLWLAPAASGTS